MRISFKPALMGAIVVGLAVGVGLGAYQSAAKQGASSVAGVASAEGTAPSSARTGGGQSTEQSGGRTTMGVVEKVGDKEFTLKTSSDSSSATVRVNDQTAIRKQVSGTLSDIQQGERVSIRGDSQADGSIAAASVQLGAAGQMVAGGEGVPSWSQGQSLGQRAQTGGQSGSGDATQGGRGNNAQGGRGGTMQGGMAGSNQGGTGIVVGTVGSVADNVISVNRQPGPSGENTPVKVTISDKTTVTKVDTGDFEDITEGASVAVVGPRGADGVVLASSVQILPADAAQMMRRQ